MPSQPFPAGALVSAYLRDSGGESQDLSVPQQEASFRAWCSKNGLIPGAIFNDAARPGSTTVGRNGFQNMIHHFRSGHAQEAGLVIWSYSRFARDFDDAQFYRADLRRRGYLFHSLNDEIPEGPIGRLFEAAIDWKNEQFLEDLSRDVKRGLYDLVQRYGAMPGTPPRGFLRVPITIGQRRDGAAHIVHRWQPDPDLIPIIQQAFSMRAARQPIKTIHQTTKIFTSINSYTTFFNNKLFIGTLEFGPLTIENYCPPIIDRPTWDTVQTIVKEYSNRINMHQTEQGNPLHPRRIHSRYLLTGLAYCARCGSPLFGASTHILNRKKKVTSERYACTRSYRRHDCDLPAIPMRTTEKAILHTLRAHILNPDVIAGNQDILHADQNQNISRLNTQRSELIAQHTGLRRRIANITNAIAEVGHSRAILEKLTTLETEETTLLSQIADIERQTANPPDRLTPAEIATASDKLTTLLESGDLPTMQQILRGIIHRITIDRHDNTVIGQITYHLHTSPRESDVTISSPPLGAPPHSNITFTIDFTLQVNSKKPLRQ